jgi:hypothetical protein
MTDCDLYFIPGSFSTVFQHARVVTSSLPRMLDSVKYICCNIPRSSRYISMANRVAVVTSSIACLTRELVKQCGIGIVPISLLVQSKVCRDLADITPSEDMNYFS